MSAEIGALIPDLQPFARELIRAAGAAGLMPRVTSTLRTRAEQTRLYRRYQSGLQSLPVAPPGTSAHEFGYAFDMIVTPYDALSDVGDYWKGMGGVWGGEFNDPVHFEFPGFSARGSAGGGASGSFASSADTALDILDFASSFIPYVGGAQLAALMISWLVPSIKETTAYDMLERPAHYLEKWAEVKLRFAGFL